jgi:hypothetical protein
LTALDMYVPVEQVFAVHTDLPFSAWNLPIAQPVHSVCPTTPTNCPAAQSLHTCATRSLAALELYVPVAQVFGVHADWPFCAWN